METVTLKVFPRTPGKRYGNEARAKGLLPVNIYGKALEKNITGSVERGKMIKALLSPKGRNVVLTLETPDKKVLAIPQQIDIDPIKNAVRHIDLLVIAENEPVTVFIPVIREGRSQGEILGGRTLLVLREVPVRCLPANIPEKIVVDVTPYDIGGRVMLKDLAYPEGVTPAMRENVPVIVVNKGRGQTAEEEAAAAGEAKPGEGEGEAKAAEGTEGVDKKGAKGADKKGDKADKKGDKVDKKAEKADKKK